MTICLDIDPETDLSDIPEKTGLEFYRIVQECINNALKHANASLIEVLLYIESNELHLTIIDDGKGFDPDMRLQGVGLLILRERAKSLNGTLQINSASNKGTEVCVIIPLNGTN